MTEFQQKTIAHLKAMDWSEEGRTYLSESRDGTRTKSYSYRMVNASGVQAYVYPGEVLHFPPRQVA